MMFKAKEESALSKLENQESGKISGGLMKIDGVLCLTKPEEVITSL